MASLVGLLITDLDLLIDEYWLNEEDLFSYLCTDTERLDRNILTRWIHFFKHQNDLDYATFYRRCWAVVIRAKHPKEKYKLLTSYFPKLEFHFADNWLQDWTLHNELSSWDLNWLLDQTNNNREMVMNHLWQGKNSVQIKRTLLDQYKKDERTLYIALLEGFKFKSSDILAAVRQSFQSPFFEVHPESLQLCFYSHQTKRKFFKLMRKLRLNHFVGYLSFGNHHILEE